MRKKNNKTITAIGMAALLTAAGVITACAAQSPTIVAGSSTAQAEAEQPGPGTAGSQEESAQAPIWGSITSVNGSSMIEGDVIVQISGDTLILDGENGYPVDLKDLQEGDTVYAYIGPAMTMSLPPQTSGEVLIAKIPADMKAPEYITVKSMTADADGNWKLVSTAGTEYAVAADCRIMPYLTRQIVSLEDVAQGSNLLVWSNAENQAQKLVLFAR